MQSHSKIHNFTFRLTLTIILTVGGFVFPILFLLAALVGWALIQEFRNPPQEIDGWFTRRWTTTGDDPNWKSYFLPFCESPAETAFLEAMISKYNLVPKEGVLHGNDVSLDLQVKIPPYRADFLVNNSLVVEIDGATYHSSPEAMHRDKVRDEFMKELGFSVLRIPAKVVFSAPDEALQQVSISIATYRQVNPIFEEDTQTRERNSLSFQETLISVNNALNDMNDTIITRQIIERETKEFSHAFYIEKLAIESAISFAENKIKEDQYILSLKEADRDLYLRGKIELQDILNKDTETTELELISTIPAISNTTNHRNPKINEAINNARNSLVTERNNFFNEIRIKLNSDVNLKKLVWEKLYDMQCGTYWEYIS